MFKNIPSFVAAAILMALCANAACADIYQWEYVNPSDPSQGKQQSLTLALGGVGVVAQPGADLHSLDLTMAYLAYQNLSGADLQLANLTSAIFYTSSLTNANFAGAIVKGADFWSSGFTASQLTTTASYVSGDLSGIGLNGINLAGVNFSNQNLTGAFFILSNVTNANFTGANVKEASFSGATGFTASQLTTTASYVNGDLSGIKLQGINLTGVNFTNQNLTNADLGHSNLTSANFTGATVKGADFSFAFGTTASQLYTTASYTNGDLSGIKLRGSLLGWNFANQNLTGANFGDFSGASNLTNVNFGSANLTGATFRASTLTNANFASAIVKGADFKFANGFTFSQLYSTASYVNGDLSGIGLGGLNLAGVNFANQNLAGANFAGQSDNTNLTNANFNGANLTGTSLGSSTLTSANFTGATIKGVDFTFATGFAASQLTSTASYTSGDLSGIVLKNDSIDLNGVNFANFNLSGADFGDSNLTSANFTNANLVSANFDPSPTNSILTSANFTGANLTGANLNSELANANFTNANLTGATVGGGLSVTNANFTGATIKGARLYSHGFTTSQLYSTASYAIGDLSGINLIYDLPGVNLANQNLTGAIFYSDLTNATFAGANLTGASFYGSNLTGADLRGASGWSPDADYTVTHNAILLNGSIQGLSLLAGEKLVIRNNPMPIRVNDSAAFDPASTFQTVIDGNAWGSTISFAPGVPVALGGTLELDFASGMSLAGQVGRTFDLFDWTGVSPTGAFTVSSPYTWNLTNLYTTGEVTLLAIPGLPGDFNHDGTVDSADYIVLRKTGGSPTDYNNWRTHFGQTAFGGASIPSGGSLSAVPEPTCLVLVSFGLGLVVTCRCRRSTNKFRPAYTSSAAVVLVAASASVLNVPAAQAASITALANLGGTVHAAGVSNDGKAIVGSFSGIQIGGGGSASGFLWMPSGNNFLGGVSSADAITPDASVIVGSRTVGQFGSGPPQPYRWTQATGSVALGLPSGTPTAGAFAASADGSIVLIQSGHCGAGGCYIGDGQFFRWTQSGGIVPLGFSGGWGTGASADGSVIVGYRTGPKAFRWSEATGAVEMGTLNDATSSEAHAVSADGSTVVGESGGHAFRWTAATGMVDLGPGEAQAVSADGSVIIGGADPDSTNGEAFYWTNAGGRQLLADVLQNDYGLDLTDWYLGEALTMSANGRMIVGRGYSPIGDRLFLADLSVPEPCSLPLLAFAFAMTIPHGRGVAKNRC